MRNMLALFALVLLLLGGLGWYLDWYRVESGSSTAGERNVNININSKKIGQDVYRGAESGAERLQQYLGKNRPSESPATPEADPGEKDKPQTNP